MAREPEELVEMRRVLGAQLAAFRQAVQLSQGQLARAALVDRTTVAHIEKGRSRADERFWTVVDHKCRAQGALLAGFHTWQAARQEHDVRIREAELAAARARAQELRVTLAPQPRLPPDGLVLPGDPEAAPGTATPGDAEPAARSTDLPVSLPPAGRLTGESATAADATTPGATGQAPERAEVTNAKRRELIATAVVAPEILNQVLSEAAAEALEFTRHTGISAVGRGTLEHLELVLTDLNQNYSHQPSTELFAVARAYRSRVDELIRGRHTLKELRELYLYAGCLSELLAWLANDLGHPRTARVYAMDSYAHAEQAEHGELCGWAADAMTAIVTYSEYPGGAVQAATKGITQVPTGHPLAIRLRAKAARAYARLGDQDKCETLLAEAQ